MFKTLGNIMPAAPNGVVGLLAVSTVVLLFPGAVLAQGLGGYTFPQLTLVDWLLFFGVLVGIWVIFYYLMYPYFIRFVSPSYGKVLFWSLTLFYGLTWLHLSSYFLFRVAGYWTWTRWVMAGLTGLWLLWLIGVLVRSRRGA